MHTYVDVFPSKVSNKFNYKWIVHLAHCPVLPYMVCMCTAELARAGSESVNVL